MSTDSTAKTPRRASLREEQKLLTRTRLIDAARAQFTARGYAAVTIDDIVADVGCSRATFYLHFPAKIDVLLALADSSVWPSAVTVYQDLDRVLATGSRVEFAAWVANALQWFGGYAEMFRAWDEATALEPEFREIARAGIATLPGSMTQYLERWPDDRRDEARLRVELLVAQLERFFVRWATLGTIEGSAELAVRVLTDVWFPALTVPE
ncbi:TetR/AcrR family transcriptional regulator [Gordonia neofelifaecis]|uniref:TetR family transcriptional regulator n=1 Tax=Gordonia neofelifaecis NRRL B-59395 TaxID=644548 RepID=F1YKV1_9ACTN|nr:TetR/AcrR family transcriptional regulator [Gordonia neofelifaecis]EGD54745.1 TetR family transcriptional regulator [Gordonia neofelifaecis NRRL B-59395]